MRRNRAVKEYELMLAHNFLGNISLDGSHNDTSQRIFNQPGLPKLNFRKRPTSSDHFLQPVQKEDEGDDSVKKQVSFFEHVAVTELSPDEQAGNCGLGVTETQANSSVLSSGQPLVARKSSRHDSDCRRYNRKEVDGSNESLNILQKISHFFHSLDKSGFDKLDRSGRLEVNERDRHLSGSSGGDVGPLRPFEFNTSHSEISYGDLLVPYTPESENNKKGSVDDIDYVVDYDPYLLDNPNFTVSSAKKCASLVSYSFCVAEHNNFSALKKETNERFRLYFPCIDLTFSKFCSIKKEMKKICCDNGIDLLTLAHAYVYLEKIVLSALICKGNRKQVAACCLLVAAKLNDYKGECLHKFLESIEDELRVNRKEFFALELPVVLALQFNLYLPDSQLFPHYHKLVWTV